MDVEGETSVKDSPHSRRTGTDAATDAIGNQAPETAAELATGSGAPQPRERTLEQALGQQVRALRRDLDLTVSDLASAAGIAVGTLSKIENGLISPSLATLQAISTVLNVPISSLFTSFEEKRDCSYVQAGGGVRIERRGTKVGHQYELLGHALGGEVAVEPYLITLSEEAVPYSGFRHAGVEFIHMLTGEVVYRHGERTYHLKPGDSLLFDSAASHGPEELLVRPMTYLSIIIYPREAG
ncbi:XRE family transcriptional regulator [Ancylobacter sp. TS-1]|uniref:helix-turn-helix domain-containing protein n=1 Tax=Ancylobacter sp. TS-1 TaxID=1850374 RepID=UPI001265C913|nr:XRE family transcriptional regulator [Ancylobacter sp. TS-1]QFR34794.1 helix-turn-helix domain-containing protein [Ancylobacter sp. TS-1]